MNYIVFDLEWNQPIDGKSFSDRKLPFEIIEIGAVKLDENKNKIAEFSEIIRPQVYKELNVHIKKILNTSMSELKKGETFPKIMKRFERWCGDNIIYCTWGSQDLTELQRNINYYGMNPISREPILFLNLQKAFAVHMGDPEKIYNLESAVDELNLEKDIPFHRAFSDAYYTAKILSYLKDEDLKKAITYDLYNLPVNAENEIQIFDGDLSYYVSQGYVQREMITGNKDIMAICCEQCKEGRHLRKIVSWFSSNSKNYYGAAICSEHGYLKSKLRIRHHENGLYYAEKFTEFSNKDEVNAIKEKKKLLKSKSENNTTDKNQKADA